jgi:hypothetical protein
LRLTNALVIGDNPGQKKILEAHKQGLSIVNLDKITFIITNDRKTAQDLLLAPYPEASMENLTQHNIQMKCPPQPQTHQSTAVQQAAQWTQMS